MDAKERAFYAQFPEYHGCRVLWHNSPEEYVEFLENPVVAHSYLDETRIKERRSYASDWAGLGYEACVDKIRWGDNSRAALAEKIFDEVIASDIITIGRPEIVPAVVGAIPNVPAVLAGMPETMLARTSTDAFSASAPIRIFLDCGISAGVTVPQLIKRGVAALAFTMVMKQIRPIELYALIAYMPHGSYKSASAINIIRIETNPLDLARSSWILTDPGFARRLSFPTAVYMVNDIIQLRPDTSCSIAWAFDSYPATEGYIDKIRKAIDIQPQDIFIKGGALDDTLMLEKPVEWINKMILENKELSEKEGMQHAA